MSDDMPLVWHYGLMAERWAEFIRETPELAFFQQAVSRFDDITVTGDYADGPATSDSEELVFTAIKR